MAGIVEDLLHGTHLNDAACVHDHHVVGHLGNDTQIVGDEQNRAVHLVLQIPKQVKDLSLDGHVKRRGGLVSDDEAGVAGQRHGDHDALAHTARQLVGECLVDTLGGGDAHQREHFHRAGLGHLLGSTGNVDEGDLIQLVADGEHGVQGGHGLLKDHGDLAAADAVDLMNGHIGDVEHLVLHLVEGGAVLIHLARGDHVAVGVPLVVMRVEADGARNDLTLRALQELHDRHRGDRLTAARFAHHANGGVLGNVEGHAVDRLDHTLIREEVGVQVVDLQNVGGILHLSHELGLVGLTVLALFQGVHDLAILLGNGADLFTREVVGIFLFCHNDSSLPP